MQQHSTYLVACVGDFEAMQSACKEPLTKLCVALQAEDDQASLRAVVTVALLVPVEHQSLKQQCEFTARIAIEGYNSPQSPSTTSRMLDHWPSTRLRAFR